LKGQKPKADGNNKATPMVKHAKCHTSGMGAAKQVTIKASQTMMRSLRSEGPTLTNIVNNLSNNKCLMVELAQALLKWYGMRRLARAEGVKYPLD